ncbi:MAG: cupredoxin domain-containing protein [Actinomycetota bacterium]
MRRLRFLAVLAVLVLGAAACGNDNPTTPASQSSTTPPGSTASPLTNKGTKDISTMANFTIEQDDNYFEPTFMKVKNGQKLSIELENEGSNQHTFTITGLNIDQVVDPGQKKEIEITFSGTSDIAFFCRFHGAGGMRGAFFFGSAPTDAAAGSSGGTSGGGTTGNTTY